MSLFDLHAQRYDRWFERREAVYQSELNAVRAVFDVLPPFSRALEIGTGTGRFSVPLGIAEGVEPSDAMRQIAMGRGLDVVAGVGEKLPFPAGSYDLVMMITTICFVDDPKQVCREARRVLRPGGSLVLGFVDRNSFLGKEYILHRAESPFYEDARFFSVAELYDMMTEAGFDHYRYSQTLFQDPVQIHSVEPVMTGYGRGGFVVIGAQASKGGTA